MTDSKLDVIIIKLQGLENEILGVKDEVTDMKSDIHGLKDEVASMKSGIHGLKDEVNVIKTQLDENTQITKAIHHRQSESDAKLEGFSLDFAKLHGEVVSTKDNVIALIEDQRSINEVIGDHEISIRSLRRKSV